MADLSQLSDEELKQMYSASQKPVEAAASSDLSKMSDADLKALYSSYQSQDQQAPKKGIIDDVADPIIAAGSGVAEGAGRIANSLGGLFNELIGHVSPKAKAFLDKGDAALSKHISETEQANKIPEAKAEYPRLNAVGQGAGMAGGVLASGGLGGDSTIAQMTGQGIIGAAMAGEGNRALGFTGGAVLPALASTVTAPLGKYLASNATLPGVITDLRAGINAAKEFPGKNIHEATDLSFAKFAETPGQVSTVRPASKINEFIEAHGSKLSPQQTQIIDETNSALKQATNIEQLHSVRKAFTSDLDKLFLKGDDALVGNARKDFMTLKESLENNLQMNARKLGVIDQYKEANTLYKQSREADQINKAFDQTLQSTGHNDWAAFNNTFKKLRTDQDIKVGSGQTKAVKQAERDLSLGTKRQIQGIQAVIKEASSLYGIQHTSMRVGGVGIGDMVLGGLKTLANVPYGKQILIKAGTPGGRALAKRLLQGLVNIGQAEYLKTANPQDEGKE